MRRMIKQNKHINVQKKDLLYNDNEGHHENPDEYYKSISLKEIKFPTIQRYFLRGNIAINYRNFVSLTETAY